MQRNTLVLKLFASTLWEYRQVFEIYTRGVSIGPRYLHFGDISNSQNSLIFRKIAFIRPVRQLEFRRKASIMGIRNSYIVKNRGQHVKEWCYVVHELPFPFFSIVLIFFCFFFFFVHIRIHPGRRRRAGNDRIRQISRDFRKQDSEIGSGLQFRLISCKFRYPDLINVSVCRFPSGSGVSSRWPDPNSVPFRSGTDIEARIRPFPRGSSRFNYSTNTRQSSESTGTKLTLCYLANY